VATRWLPRGFAASAGFEHRDFRVRPLTIRDAELDFEAVTASCEHLWSLFGEAWGWPPEDLDLEQDTIDVAWHQKEAQLTRSYAYAVVSHDESKVLGCIYLDPPTRQGYDAEAFWWGRSDQPGLEEEIGAAAREWIASHWPFERVAFPGRVEPWEEYRALPAR